MTLSPLFGGLPGGIELLVFLLLTLITFVVPVGLAVYVWQDARDRTDHPAAWGVAVFVAGFSPFFVGAVAVTVLYLVVRDELGAAAPPTFTEADMDEDAQVLGQPLGGGATESGTGGEDDAAADTTGDGGDGSDAEAERDAAAGRDADDETDTDRGDGDGSDGTKTT